MVMLQELFSLLITSCASKVASSLRTLWLVRNMLIQYQIILRQNRFFCNVSVEDRKLTPERVILLLDIRTGVPSPTYVFLLVFLFFITIKELFAVGGQVLLKSLLSTLNNPSLQLLNKPSMEEERFVVPVDPFASGRNF